MEGGKQWKTWKKEIYAKKEKVSSERCFILLYGSNKIEYKKNTTFNVIHVFIWMVENNIIFFFWLFIQTSIFFILTTTIEKQNKKWTKETTEIHYAIGIWYSKTSIYTKNNSTGTKNI